MAKGIPNGFDHMGFCLVLNLTTTCTDGKGAVILPPNFVTNWVTTAFCQLKKFIYNTAVAKNIISSMDSWTLGSKCIKQPHPNPLIQF